MNTRPAAKMPPPYLVRKEVDHVAGLLRQLQESKEREAQNHTAGVAEGWRQSWGWRARNTAVLIAFGVCVGVVMTLVLLPMIGFIFGVNA